MLLLRWLALLLRRLALEGLEVRRLGGLYMPIQSIIPIHNIVRLRWPLLLARIAAFMTTIASDLVFWRRGGRRREEGEVIAAMGTKAGVRSRIVFSLWLWCDIFPIDWCGSGCLGLSSRSVGPRPLLFTSPATVNLRFVLNESLVPLLEPTQFGFGARVKKTRCLHLVGGPRRGGSPAGSRVGLHVAVLGEVLDELVLGVLGLGKLLFESPLPEGCAPGMSGGQRHLISFVTCP